MEHIITDEEYREFLSLRKEKNEAFKTTKEKAYNTAMNNLKNDKKWIYHEYERVSEEYKNLYRNFWDVANKKAYEIFIREFNRMTVFERVLSLFRGINYNKLWNWFEPCKKNK